MKLFKEYTVKRKIFGIGILSFIIGLFAIGGASALAYYWYISYTSINVGEPALVTTNIPATLSLYAGDFVNYSFIVTNRANVPLDFLIYTNLSNEAYPLENGEANLRLEIGGIIIAENSSASDNTLKLTTSQMRWASAEAKTFSLSLQMNQSADNSSSYILTSKLIPINFTWR